MMEKNAKIYVAGHRGMVGSAIVRELQRQGYTNIITRTHKELDLCRQEDVERFFAEEKPEYVFLAAAKVGGIVANQEALADFMWFNMTLEMNVIHSAWQNGCKKLEFLGSSCIYPRMAPQPMKESCLLTSELEKTNEAKIPVYGSEIEQMKKGCAAGAGLDYVQLGIQTGKMAAKVLTGEATCQDMPYEVIENYATYINSKSLEQLGITLPDDVAQSAEDVANA